MKRHHWLVGAAGAAVLLSVGQGLAETTPASTAPASAAPAARPAHWSDKSYYLPMRDGVRLAVSLYFPDHVAPGRPTPTVLEQTRYGRATTWRFVEAWRQAGYVVMVVDTRGSTASFGPRDADISPQEIADMDELVTHIQHQPWSDGRVIASGVSYMADTADLITSRQIPGLKGSIPRETDFDAWLELFFPGGVANDFMMQGWGGYGFEIDQGRDGQGAGLDCLKTVADCPKLFPTLQPVDGDDDYAQLRLALGSRHHWKPDDYVDVAYRDQKAKNGMDMMVSSPAGHIAEIRAQNKPVQYWGSWYDAGTAEAALARFRSAPKVPHEIWITANNHGHNIFADPLFPADKAPMPAYDEQYKINFDFAKRALAGTPIKRNIHYYVVGAKAFKDTPVWPPAGVKMQKLGFASGHTLAAKPGARGVDSYDVDFTATTGKSTRWSTQFGAPPAYADRRDADKKLLVYDAPPVDRDMELAGYPVADLRLSASTSDLALFVYIEDVGPDGRVTYLDEGQLRAIHRKPANPAKLPYDQGPAAHSFLKADALPVKPGEEMRLRFALNPIAAVIRTGHHLRVAIAGADADTFHRYSEGKAETFKVRIGQGGSAVYAPMRPWVP